MPPTHLVIVCCHGIWLGDPARRAEAAAGDGARDEEWLLAGFQAGEPPTFVEHIKAGLRALRDDPDAVLVFSGGPTRRETRLSEAESYARLAAANGYFGLVSPSAAAGRVACETRALDSYYNVLFSLLQFRRDCDGWPARLTVVSHAFKRERLVDGHCAALGYPLARVRFVGVDPPAMADGSNQAALGGVAQAMTEWRADPHGTGPSLAEKRRSRNPWDTPQDLFLREEDRVRSGVRTTMLGHQEVLDPNETQPWSSLSSAVPQRYQTGADIIGWVPE